MAGHDHPTRLEWELEIGSEFAIGFRCPHIDGVQEIAVTVKNLDSECGVRLPDPARDLIRRSDGLIDEGGIARLRGLSRKGLTHQQKGDQ